MGESVAALVQAHGLGSYVPGCYVSACVALGSMQRCWAG